MAEDFPATGICGGSWWSLPKNDHLGSFGSWLINDLADLKPKSCKLQQDSININSSLAFQDLQKPHRSSDSDHGGGFMDSSMGFGVSSSSDWTQTLLRGNLQEDLNLQVQKDWSPKSFSATSTQQDSSINTYKATNFSLEQQEIVNPLTNSGNSYVYQSSPLIQSLFEPSDDHRTAVSYSNSSPQNYGALLNQLSPSFLQPSISNQQSQISNGLNFSNNTTFWNNSPEFPPPNSQPPLILPSFGDKPGCPNLTSKPNNEAQVTKKVSEPALKRARIETPSPLPTFKVRKEKLGDRITALQQLVSPFGKTDTASVLHEAIEYIKFLHDQVNVLSTPYMKNGNPIQHLQVLSTPYMKNGNPIQHQQVGEREVSKEDLKSRGLCLVPIASTFPVAHETTADFWTPTFGGSLSISIQPRCH